MVDDDLRTLPSAEAFFDYLGVAFDEDFVAVNRMKILKGFRERIDAHPIAEDEEEKRRAYARCLEQAYLACRDTKDVVLAAARAAGPGVHTAFIPVSQLGL